MKRAIFIIFILILSIPFNMGGCVDTQNEINAGAPLTNLYSLTIIPLENKTTISLASSDKTLQLMLKGKYSDGSEKMIDAVRADWAPSNGTAGVISINGLFTAQKEGTITITATIGTIKDEVLLTVTK